MEQENRTGCILHGLRRAGRAGRSVRRVGCACVFALTPGWRVWALPVFFLLALAGSACGLLLYAAGSALQILCDIRRAVLGRDGTARAGKKTPSICFLRSSAEPDRLLTWHRTFKQKSVPHWPEGPCRALFFFFIAKAGTRIGVFENRENAAFPARIERLQGKKCGSTCGISRILNAANANSHWGKTASLIF